MAERTASKSKFVAPAVICAFAVLILVWTYDYQPAMRRLPLLVAWSTIVLAILDGLSRTESGLGRTINGIFSWGFGMPEVAGRTSPSPRSEVRAIAWIIGFVALVVAVGFYVAIPAYILLATRVQARAGWLASIAAALAVLGGVWALFFGLLEYNIYGGLLFR